MNRILPEIIVYLYNTHLLCLLSWSPVLCSYTNLNTSCYWQLHPDSSRHHPGTWGQISHQCTSERQNAVCSQRGLSPVCAGGLQKCIEGVPAANGCSAHLIRLRGRIVQVSSVHHSFFGSTDPPLVRSTDCQCSYSCTGHLVYREYRDVRQLSKPLVFKASGLVCVLLGFMSITSSSRGVNSFPFNIIQKSRQMLLLFMCKSPMYLVQKTVSKQHWLLRSSPCLCSSISAPVD